jgi:hypothetical protein
MLPVKGRSVSTGIVFKEIFPGRRKTVVQEPQYLLREFFRLVHNQWALNPFTENLSRSIASSIG